MHTSDFSVRHIAAVKFKVGKGSCQHICMQGDWTKAFSTPFWKCCRIYTFRVLFNTDLCINNSFSTDSLDLVQNRSIFVVLVYPILLRYNLYGNSVNMK